MLRKVCIITPGTIASNPRVVKEASALSEAGYQVHLIYTRHVGYLIKTDQEILDDHPEWTYDQLDWTGGKFISKVVKFLSGIKRKWTHLLLRKDIYPSAMAPYLINRFYFWQLNKAISCKADLYIAHYPDSIGIAAKAAKINNSLFAYDAEDYHRGEDLPAEITKIISINEDQFLNNAAYITAASVLIAKAYKKLYPEKLVTPIENMFPLKNQLPFQKLKNSPFKFFWFSQTIGPNRGLEPFITLLGLCASYPMQLTLLGSITKNYELQLKEHWKNAGLRINDLQFIDTVPEKEVFGIASHHHFGLCLEIPLVPNKDYCMSNKLYSYILSGNLLILSKTEAQNSFHKVYPKTGISMNLNKPKESAEQLSKLMANAEDLNERRRANYQLGRSTLNFDREKAILLKQVESLWK